LPGDIAQNAKLPKTRSKERSGSSCLTAISGIAFPPWIQDSVIHWIKRNHLYQKELVLCATNWDRIEALGYEWDHGPQDDPDNSKRIRGLTIKEIRRGESLRNDITDFDDPAVIAFDPKKLVRDAVGYEPAKEESLRDSVLVILRVFSENFL
jgi:hypothetical protein